MAQLLGASLGLGAIQFLPFVELLRHSQRGAAFASGGWTLSWAGLGNFLVPLFHTVQNRDGVFFQPDQQWVSSYYPGSTIVLLWLIALASERTRRVRWLTLFCLVSLALALGRHGFLYDWLRRTTPGLGMMRYPIKFIVPCAVMLPLLGGFGVRYGVFRCRQLQRGDFGQAIEPLRKALDASFQALELVTSATVQTLVALQIGERLVD